MKPFLILLTVLTISTFRADAQTASDSVTTVINNLFTAMRNADGNLLKSCFADSAVLQTIIKNKQGKIEVRDEQVSGFISFVSNEPKGNADERNTIETLKIDGDLAIAWCPYEFYYKGKFTHCGVNSFQLVRFSDGWKIQYLVDTRRKVCK